MTPKALQAKGFVEGPPGQWTKLKNLGAGGGVDSGAQPPTPQEARRELVNRQSVIRNESSARAVKPLLNKTEGRYKLLMESKGIRGIMEQAIALRLDPPYKSYRPDLAYPEPSRLCFVEVKGPHRFRAAGIAKAALAAKTYPQFIFRLAEWTGQEWKESVLSP